MVEFSPKPPPLELAAPLLLAGFALLEKGSRTMEGGMWPSPREALWLDSPLPFLLGDMGGVLSVSEKIVSTLEISSIGGRLIPGTFLLRCRPYSLYTVSMDCSCCLDSRDASDSAKERFELDRVNWKPPPLLLAGKLIIATAVWECGCGYRLECKCELEYGCR